MRNIDPVLFAAAKALVETVAEANELANDMGTVLAEREVAYRAEQVAQDNLRAAVATINSTLASERAAGYRAGLEAAAKACEAMLGPDDAFTDARQQFAAAIRALPTEREKHESRAAEASLASKQQQLEDALRALLKVRVALGLGIHSNDDLAAVASRVMASRDALRHFVDNNMTFYDPRDSNGPVLRAKRIWYHATDDEVNFPFSAVIDAAQETKR